MRKSDKKQNIKKANILAENRYLNRVSETPTTDWVETDKWSVLEKEVNDTIIPIIERHKTDFGNDSYAVIDAIQQVFEQMFQKVKR